MNRTEYQTRFIQHMMNLNVCRVIATQELEAIVEMELWNDIPATPEDDADQAMSYWED